MQWWSSCRFWMERPSEWPVITAPAVGLYVEDAVRKPVSLANSTTNGQCRACCEWPTVPRTSRTVRTNLLVGVVGDEVAFVVEVVVVANCVREMKLPLLSRSLSWCDIVSAAVLVVTGTQSPVAVVVASVVITTADRHSVRRAPICVYRNISGQLLARGINVGVTGAVAAVNMANFLGCGRHGQLLEVPHLLRILSYVDGLVLDSVLLAARHPLSQRPSRGPSSS